VSRPVFFIHFPGGGKNMKAILRIPDPHVAEEHGLQAETLLGCNQEYCATSYGYPVFQLPNGDIFTGEMFRTLRDACGATLETDNLTMLCMGICVPRTEPGLAEIGQ
jgi:hypothetical protein